jgi:hypothetical protein
LKFYLQSNSKSANFFNKKVILFFSDETGSSIFIFGGFNSYFPYDTVSSVSYFNISKNGTLVDKNLFFTEMPQPQRDHCSVGYAGNFAFIIGGQTTGSTMINTSIIFNIRSSIFVHIFSLSRPRLNPTCNIVGTKIIIAGGFSPASGTSGSLV